MNLQLLSKADLNNIRNLYLKPIKRNFGMFKKVLIALLFGSFSILFSSAAHSANDDGYPLTVGIANNPPNEWMGSDGQGQGFCPELLNEIMDHMGQPRPEYVLISTGYAGLVPGVLSGRLDAAMCFGFTAPRCEQLDFVDPFDGPEAGFATLVNKPAFKSVKEVKDNPDVKIGVFQGSAYIKELTSRGVPQDRLVQFANNRDGNDGLVAGRVDALFSNAPGLFYTTDDAEIVVNIAEDVAPRPEGLAFRKGDARANDINKALAELKANDVFNKVSNKWKYNPDVVVNLTAKDNCAQF